MKIYLFETNLLLYQKECFLSDAGVSECLGINVVLATFQLYDDENND